MNVDEHGEHGVRTRTRGRCRRRRRRCRRRRPHRGCARDTGRAARTSSPWRSPRSSRRTAARRSASDAWCRYRRRCRRRTCRGRAEHCGSGRRWCGGGPGRRRGGRSNQWRWGLSKIDGRSQCMGATAAMGNWVRRRGWKMVMAMAKAACEAADRVAPTMGLWWRGGDGDNGGSSEREEVQRWPSRARTGRARTVERVGRAKG